MTSMSKKPLLFVSDSISGSSGLGRITRDLATRVHEHLGDVYRVGTVGYGGFGSRKFPWTDYHLHSIENWLIPELPAIADDFAGDDELTIMFVWDASRLYWLGTPQKCPSPHLRRFAERKDVKKWVYGAIDAEGPFGKLPQSIAETYMGFDRVIDYSAFSSKITGHPTWLPHGIDTNVFKPQSMHEARAAVAKGGFIGLTQNSLLIGIVATNQARKNWQLGFATARVLLDRGHDVRVWCHTDVIDRYWSLSNLIVDYGLMGRVAVTTQRFTDENLAGMYAACLPDGELVRTPFGECSIETVGSEGTLIDECGQETQVHCAMRREFSGKIYAIRTYGASRPTRFTGNHPIRVVRGKDWLWINAENIKKGDVIPYPITARTVMNEHLLCSFWTPPKVRKEHRLSRKILISSDFWWMVGLWLADGHSRWLCNGSSASLQFSLNGTKDYHIGERLCSFWKKMNREAASRTKSKGCLEITLHSVEIVHFLETYFGKGAAGKSVPSWIKHLPEELLLSFLRGYFEGDGCIVNRKGASRLISFVSISESLMRGIQDIFLSLGMTAPIHVLHPAKFMKIESRKCWGQKTYALTLGPSSTEDILERWGKPSKKISRKSMKQYTWIEGGFLFSKVHSVEVQDYEGYVNNFETESHTFCAGLISTHNCNITLGIGVEGFGFPIAESLACGVPCIVGSYGAQAEFVPKDMQVDPVGYYYEGAYCSKRPVHDPEQWATKVEQWSLYRTQTAPVSLLPECVDWNGSTLWPVWEKWFKEGVQ